MRKKVFRYLEEQKMIGAGMKVLVGFSGGADSTALLQLLWEYGKEQEIEVRALHVNHGIRGESARRDQVFCENFCRERGIPLRTVCGDVPEVARQEGIGLEEAGRKVRYAAFGQELAGGYADRVALAHHQNDQAETMLFHLMRGTGLRGLRGMEPVRMPYIRPFLCVTKSEIEQWLLGEGIPWMEDESNQELKYTRNQIRQEILAPMERIRPGSAARMAGTAGQLLEMEDYLEQETEKAWRVCVREDRGIFRISLEALETMHPVLRKRIAFQCMEQLMGRRKDLEMVHVEHALALMNGKRGSRVMLPDGCTAVLGYGEILFKRGYGSEKTEEEVYCVPDGVYFYMGEEFCFSLEDREKNGEIPVNRYTKWFDYDKIKDSVVLRTRRPGDYLELAGGAHKKLKDYLIDCKVPREERDRCILLADGSHVIWIAGMRISERYKVTEQTKRILKVHKMEDGGTKGGETSY